MEDTLCQSEGLSCAGCCYDMKGYRKEDLERLFRHTRDTYKRLVEGASDIDGYIAAVKGFPIEIIWNTGYSSKKCHFVGFLDDEGTRVGCLAHPKANHGKDIRDKGQHGSAEFCNRWFCDCQKIYSRLEPNQKEIFMNEISDHTWYDPINTNDIRDRIIELFGSKNETWLNNLSILLGGRPFRGW
jgi:hypothetical protein